MRVVRPFAGLFLGILGAVLVLAAGAGWQLVSHRDPNGAFSADLSPVYTDGYAIVVPDIGAALHRHGLARLVDARRLQLGVASSAPVVLAVAPASDVNTYLDGVARTVVTGVGYAVGAQPVSVSHLVGTAEPSRLPQRPTWAVASDRLTVPTVPPAEAGSPMSLLVLRVDGRSGFTATLSVGLSPPAGIPAVSGLAFVTGLILVGGAVFLVRPVHRRRRERFVRVAPEYGDDEADWVVGAYDAEPEPAPPGPSPYIYTAT